MLRDNKSAALCVQSPSPPHTTPVGDQLTAGGSPLVLRGLHRKYVGSFRLITACRCRVAVFCRLFYGPGSELAASTLQGRRQKPG